MAVDSGILLAIIAQILVVIGATLKIGQWMGMVAQRLDGVLKKIEDLESGKSPTCVTHSQDIVYMKEDISEIKKKLECYLNGKAWDSQL